MGGKANKIFGKFSWTSPPWVNRLRQRAKQHPRQTGTSILIAVVLILGLVYGYKWYQSLPKPERVVAKITTPKLTPVEASLIPDPLIIDFGIPYGNELNPRQVAPLSLVGKDISKGISLYPDIQGKWRWDTDSRLIFTPDQDWPAEQTYQVSFDRDFFAHGTKMEAWEYTFTTQPFTANITEFKFYQDPLNPKVRQAVATIDFSFPVDPASLADKINLSWQTLKIGQHQFKYSLKYDQHKRAAYLTSEPLPLPSSERYLQLNLESGIKAASGSGKTLAKLAKKVLIPDAQSYFKVVNLNSSIVRNEKDQPEQVLSLETSIGVREAELNKSFHAYLLPQNYPATSAETEKPNYQWRDPGEVTPAILALAKPLALTAIPSEHDFSTLHSYQYYADTPSYIYVTLDKGISGFGDFKLGKPYAAVISVPPYPQEISFLHKGALLALGSEEKLSVQVRGLDAVKFNIARVLPGDVNHLITQTSGDFSNPVFFNMTFNQNNISEIFSEIQNFDNSNAAKAQYTALDLGKYLASRVNDGGPRGLFLLQAQGWDPEKKETIDPQATRLILITDLGLIVKDNADETHDVFVQSITYGRPINNATVSLLGKNGLPVLVRHTDANGRANFPVLKDMINDREPVVYLVQSANDVSFIPYQQYERKLNYSRFDVGGVTHDIDAQSALTAYLFTDRGIYRPGDTAHIAMIVKQPYVLPQPAGLPLEATIVDPRGVTVKDEKMTLNSSGYLSLDFQPSSTAPTGQYIINLYIVKDNHASNLIGSTSIQVGEFLPDRMRISAQLSTETSKGWVSPAGLMAKIGLWNLYGAPAADHRVSGRVILTPQAISFKAFPHYIFTDPLLNPKAPPKVFTDTLSDTRTNNQGQAVLDLKLDRFEKATYEMTVFAEGFEAEGGRSVTTQTKALVSPLTYLVGYKSDGDLHYIKQNAERTVHLIAINPQLQQIEVKDLTLQRYKLQPVSTLVKKDDGTYQYQSIIQSKQVSSTPLVIAEKGNDYNLPSDEFGEYLLTINDQNGTELSKLKYSIVGDSQQPLPKNAELNVKLNKTLFNAGDEIEMQISAPYTGAGLITIERDKVYAAKWFKAETTSSLQKITIPANFQGDGYVNIAYVRDFNSPEIFMSPLSYSVMPFSVTHQDHEIKVELSAPNVAQPGTALPINYKTDKPAKIIVFAVDEGILQVTKFESPDPLAYFFQKHALEVSTQQILDQILPKFIADRELSSVGGDEGAAELNRNLNPFKRKTDAPVVFWSGILDSDTTAKTLTYQIPDYFNGTLRVMAVAVAEAAVGSASQATEVRGHFVINPNVPTFVAPGDEFDVNASIANNVEGSGANAAVNIHLTTSAGLSIEGSADQSLVVPEGKERSVHFKVKAGTTLGSAELTFTASLDNKSSKITSTLSVRPAIAYTTTIQSGFISDAEKVLAVNPNFYPAYRKANIAVSRSPLILVAGLKNYLNEYPYGCVEQLVSKAFPWLVMANQPWFVKDNTVLTSAIQKTIEILNQRQMSSGAFNYWPDVGTTASNDFASVYAMHFLTEAREQGYTVPSDVFSAGISFLKDLATQDVKDIESARIHAYAIYILTRNEIVTTNYLTNLQLSLEQNKRIDWQHDVVSAYIAATYQLLKNTTEADKLIAYYRPKLRREGDSSDFYNADIANAQYMYLLEKHFPEKSASIDMVLINSLVNALNSDTISTVLAGYASLALANYHSDAAPSSAPLSLSEILSSKQRNALMSSNDVFQQADISLGAVKVAITNPSKEGYFYQFTQSGFENKLPKADLNQGIEVYREYKTEDNDDIASPALGSEIVVHIRMRSLDNQYHNNIAIVDLLPGGFEMVPASVKAPVFDYYDAREDRVNFFGGVGPDSSEIVYKIKATSVGQFTIPPIFATAMYNPMIKSLGIAGKITVVGS